MAEGPLLKRTAPQARPRFFQHIIKRISMTCQEISERIRKTNISFQGLRLHLLARESSQDLSNGFATTEVTSCFF